MPRLFLLGSVPFHTQAASGKQLQNDGHLPHATPKSPAAPHDQTDRHRSDHTRQTPTSLVVRWAEHPRPCKCSGSLTVQPLCICWFGYFGLETRLVPELRPGAEAVALGAVGRLVTIQPCLIRVQIKPCHWCSKHSSELSWLKGGPACGLSWTGS